MENNNYITNTNNSNFNIDPPEEKREKSNSSTDVDNLKITNYLKEALTSSLPPELLEKQEFKELLEKLSKRAEILTSLDDNPVGNILMNTEQINQLTSNISQTLKEAISSIKLTDELLIISSLLVQSLTILKIKDCLKIHEQFHSELCAQLLQFPSNALQIKVAEAEAVISHLKNTLKQAEELTPLNWSQVITASAEESTNILQNFLPSLANVAEASAVTGIFTDILLIINATHGLQNCSQRDMQLSERRTILEEKLLHDKNPAMQNFYKMELHVIEQAIHESGVEMLRHCSLLTVSLSMSAIMATSAGLALAGASINPITWPITAFVSLFSVGILAYQYRHEIDLYVKLGELCLKNFGKINQHKKIVDDWEEQQSKTEIALNTSELVKNIALEIAGVTEAILKEKTLLRQELYETINPIKKAILQWKIFMLDQDEKTAVREKNDRINNVLTNRQQYKENLEAIQNRIFVLEDQMIKSSAALTDYVEARSKIQKNYKRSKIGISSPSQPIHELIEHQKELKALHVLLKKKQKEYEKSELSPQEKQDMRLFLNDELSRVEFEIKDLQEAIKQSKNKQINRAENACISHYTQSKVEEALGGLSFHQHLKQTCQIVKRDLQSRHALIDYIEQRILAENPRLTSRQIREYIEEKLQNHPENFLAWLAFQQHQHKYYSNILVVKEQMRSVYPGEAVSSETEEFKEVLLLSRPPVSKYLEIESNKIEIIHLILALLQREGVNWKHNPSIQFHFLQTIFDALNSSDIFQQEAFLRRYQLLDKYNRFKPEIAQNLIPPVGYEEVIQQNTVLNISRNGIDSLIEMTIDSLGIAA